MDSTRIYNDKLLKLSGSTKNNDIAIKGYNLSSTYYYYNSQLDSCLLLVKKSLSLLSDSKDFKMRSDIYRKLSILSRANSDYEGYESYAKQSFSDAKKSGDWELISSSLVVLGNIFYNKNDFSKALKHYLEVDSLHTVNKSKTSNLCLAYENIALIYLELKNEEALFYLDKSMVVHKELNNNSGVSNCIRLKGNFYNSQKDYPAAIKYLSEALLFYETLGEPNKLIEIYSEIIPTYAYTGNFKKAETLVEKGLEIISQKGFSKFGINAMQYATGIFYLEQKKYSKAIDFFLEAEKSAPSKGTDYYLRERKEISEALKKAYLGQRNFEKAFNINERLIVLLDSLNLQNKEKLTTEIETKYQTEKKEQEIALLKSEKELSNQKQKSERNLLFGGLALTTVAGVFLFLLYRNRQKTNKKLKELDKAKSNFFANISHEFRTPLTLIANPIDEALEDETLSDKKRNKFIMAKRNSDRLLSLVNQLLDLSKIDAGQLKLRIQKGGLQNLISGLAQSFKYSAEQNNITYNLNIEKTNQEFWFDKDALEKIIVNLLSNAIKYTPKNGSVTYKSVIENNQLMFSVKNTGVGFSKNELENIFIRFYQTDEVNEGTGIGLALVKELVELHKGVIKVESKPKQWICFSVTLPVDKKSFKENIIKDGTEPKLAYQTKHLEKAVNIDKDEVFEDNDKPILLIVEDNNDVRTLLKQNFEADYNILAAQNGQIGVDLAIEHVPDIIISDIMMPVKDGVTLTNELKNNELTSHIPIVLLTAKAGDKNEIKGLEIGADAYITKPFNSKLLKTKVTNLIDIRRKLQSRYSQEIVLTPKDIAVTNLDEQFLKKVQQVLEHNLVESSFSVGDFSDAVGMSRMQLHRKIKALTGLSTSEFIRSQRLKLAAELLKASDINISQVGYSVGFNNHSYFTKCFKEAYNYTPTDYAEIHGNK
jgi:signal transduction histidine kinase/DNA-binding response OmpR family regulator